MTGIAADTNSCYRIDYIHDYKNTSFFYVLIFINSTFTPQHDQDPNTSTEIQNYFMAISIQCKH
jgi:hypothetical protein